MTQRVDVSPHGERRDALDQRWSGFLGACGFVPVAAPNDPGRALDIVAVVEPAGLLLTGGNDLACVGGDAPERDRTEAALIDWAIRTKRPILGICRGMQVLLARFGCDLVRVEQHVAVRHAIETVAGQSEVNSYHGFAVLDLQPPLEVLAHSPDGVIEGFRHPDYPIVGLMWHPERETPIRAADVRLVRDVFGGRVSRLAL